MNERKRVKTLKKKVFLIIEDFILFEINKWNSTMNKSGENRRFYGK